MAAKKIRRLTFLERLRDRIHEYYLYGRDADIWLCIFSALEYLVNVRKREEYIILYEKISRDLADTFFIFGLFDNILEAQFYLLDIQTFRNLSDHIYNALSEYKSEYRDIVDVYYDEKMLNKLIAECNRYHEMRLPQRKPFTYNDILDIIKNTEVIPSAVSKFLLNDVHYAKKVYFAFMVILYRNLHAQVSRWMLNYGVVSNAIFIDQCYNIEHNAGPWLDIVCPYTPRDLRALLDLRRQGDLKALLKYASIRLRNLLRRDRYYERLERIYFKVIPEARREIGVLGI